MPSRRRSRITAAVLASALLVSACGDGIERPEPLFSDGRRPATGRTTSDPPTTEVGSQILGVVRCADADCLTLTFDGGYYRRGDWQVRAAAEAAIGPAIAIGPSAGAEVRRLFFVREVSVFRAAAGQSWEVIVAEDVDSSRAVKRLLCAAIEPAANDIVSDCDAELAAREHRGARWSEREQAVVATDCGGLLELIVEAVSSGDGAAGTDDDADVEPLVALIEARWAMLGCDGHLGLTSGLESPDIMRP